VCSNDGHTTTTMKTEQPQTPELGLWATNTSVHFFWLLVVSSPG
jgi:hypothetical protein